jgi:hypothetical protein
MTCQPTKATKIFRIKLKLGSSMLALYLGALNVHAATITAASAAHNDVAAAVASAENGDTVLIPAGNSTWSSALTITKAITLKGAGTASTFLRRAGNIIQLAPATDLPIRITGIYFDLSPYQNSTDRCAVYLGATCTSLRIDHCYFLNGKRSIYLAAKGYGVTDHCTFLDSNLATSPAMGFFDSGTASWAAPINPGGTDTMVIEDCTFIADSAMPDDPNECLYGWDGARCCFRHNTIDYTGTSHALAAIDAHGYHPSYGHGTRFYEIYDNTIKCKYTYRFCYLRGGTHIFYNNTFTMSNSGTPAVFSLTNEQGTTQDVISNSFFWNNTFNGSPTNAADAGQYANEPVVNRDFFNRSIQSGDTFYPYKPLVYPHPSITADDSLKSSPIENLIVIESGT